MRLNRVIVGDIINGSKTDSYDIKINIFYSQYVGLLDIVLDVPPHHIEGEYGLALDQRFGSWDSSATISRICGHVLRSIPEMPVTNYTISWSKYHYMHAVDLDEIDRRLEKGESVLVSCYHEEATIEVDSIEYRQVDKSWNAVINVRATWTD